MVDNMEMAAVQKVKNPPVSRELEREPDPINHSISNRQLTQRPVNVVLLTKST